MIRTLKGTENSFGSKRVRIVESSSSFTKLCHFCIWHLCIFKDVIWSSSRKGMGYKYENTFFSELKSIALKKI